MPQHHLLSAALLLSLSSAAVAAGPAQRALADLRANGQQLAAAAKGDLFLAKTVKTGSDGVEHVRFDRQYQGLRVIGGDVITHARNGRIQSVSTSLDDLGRPSTTPVLSADQATIEAGVRFDGRVDAVDNKGLVIYAHDTRPTLAYEVNVRGYRAHGFADRLLYIDAANGKLLGTDDIFKTVAVKGKANTLLLGRQNIITRKISSSQYLLQDPTRGNSNVRDGEGQLIDQVYDSAKIMVDADNIWGNGKESDVASQATDAHYGVGMTWDYYRNVHDRRGIYDNRVGVRSVVNVKFQFGSIVTGANAAWYGAPYNFMAYGSGDSNLYPVVALDVAGHEMTHGVTEAVNQLIYANDAGGLNEASSDIMGTMVEFYANKPADPGDYLIGEKIFRNNSNGTVALRYMFRPSADGRSWDCYPASGFIGEDPHFSSGPANLFFYLLAEGTARKRYSGVTHKGATCRPGDRRQGTGSASLAGIGRGKARAIWYRAMDLYFTSGTTYPQARRATIKAASDLFGASSQEVAAVKASWKAVNVN